MQETTCPICRVKKATREARLKIDSRMKYRVVYATIHDKYLIFPTCDSCGNKIWFDNIISQTFAVSVILFAIGCAIVWEGKLNGVIGGVLIILISIIIFVFYWRALNRINHYQELLGYSETND